ncbi:MAG: protein kinase [Planctomycetota bacterium]
MTTHDVPEPTSEKSVSGATVAGDTVGGPDHTAHDPTAQVTAIGSERFPIGTEINGRFRVLDVLGAGGFGCVYLVADQQHGDRRVALKTIQLLKANPLAVELFQKEFAELTKLLHPNIGGSYEYGRIAESGQHFYTGEYIDGKELMDGTEKASLDEKIETMAQICRALEFVHNRGLLHHDLKPGNILLAVPTVADQELAEVEGLGRLSLAVGNERRIAKLIDFGLIDRETFASDVVMGTPAYMSPERIQGLATDRRSDLYSLGALLYRMFVRCHPFRAKGQAQWINAHLRVTPPSPCMHDPDLPEPLADVILKLLEKDPSRRYGSAAEVIEALNAAVGTKHAIDTKETSTQYLVSGPIVGREWEQDQIRMSFASVLSGEFDAPRSLLLRGEPGFGTSRLIDDLRYHARREGAIVVDLDARSAPSLPEMISQIRRALAITGHSFEVAEDASVQALRLKIEEALIGLTADAPVVIAIDHVQCADDAVVTLCRELSLFLETDGVLQGDESSAPPPALLVLADSGGRDRELGLGEADPFEVVELSPLHTDEVRELLEVSFGIGEVPREFVRRLAASSGGNPLYVVEMLRHLAKDGGIRRSGGSWQFPKRLEALELPESLTHLATEKLDDLTPESQRLVQWIAAHDDPIPVDRLSALASVDGERVSGALWGLVKDQVLSRVRCSTGHESFRYRLASASLRKAILDGMGSNRRAELHLAIGEALEADPAESSIEALAYHWAEAKADDKFHAIALEAVASLQRRGELGRARALCEKAIETLPATELKTRFQALAKLSELEEAEGRPESASEAAQRLLSAAERFLKPRDRVRLRRRIGLLLGKAADAAQGVEWIDRAAKESDAAEPIDRLAVLSARLHLEATRGNAPTADGWETCLETLDALPASSDPTVARLLVSTVDLIGKIAHQLGDYPRGIACFDRGREICRELDIPQGAAASLANSGWLYFERADYKTAMRNFEAALIETRSLGDRLGYSRAMTGKAETLLARGQTTEALQAATEALREARVGGDPTAVARSLSTLGAIQHRVGDHESAADNLARAIEGEARRSLDRAVAEIRAARVEISRSDPDAAQRHLDAAVATAEALRSPRLAVLASIAEAYLEIERDAYSRARTALAEASTRAKLYAFQRERVEIDLLEATLEAIEETDRGGDAIERAVELATEIGAADLQRSSEALRRRFVAGA